MLKKSLFGLSLLLMASVLFAAYPYEYPLYLGMLGFSKNEVNDLKMGRLRTHSIKDKAPGEFGIVAAIVSNVPVYYFRDYYTYIESYKTLHSFQQVGKFKDKPDLRDLAPLRLSKDELKDYVSCKPEDCNLKLTPDEIALIPADPDLKTDAGIEEVMSTYRQILLNRLINYRKGGMEGLGGYSDDPDGSQLADIVNDHLLKFHDMTAYFPTATRYFREYPKYKNKQIQDFFFWSKESQGNKPVISLHHVFFQKVGEDYIMMNKTIYSDHYVLSSISVIHLINYADLGGPRTLMVVEQRTLTDLKSDPFRGFGRNILRVNQEKRMVAGLRSVGETMEARYIDSNYERFPYGLIPTDQR